MLDFFDPIHRPMKPDGDGNIKKFDPGCITIATDSQGSRIILFKHFLKRRDSLHTCPVCEKSFFDLDLRAFHANDLRENEQLAAMKNFARLPRGLKCDHDLRACSSCLKKSLETTFEERHIFAEQHFECLDCERVLETSEVKLYMSKAKFER